MTLEDRERNFEKALGRELKAKGASGLDCPDAETLAAYHERMLSPEEMAAQKTHIAACPRCQEILATLEVTEAIPSGAEDFQNVLEESAAPESVSAAAPASARPLEMARARSASVREMPKRKAYLRWAVPAGAIAAGLLVWIAINTNRSPMMMKQTAPVTVADNREQKEALPSAPKREERAPAASSRMSDELAENGRIVTKQESEAYALGSDDRAKTQGKPQEERTSRSRAAPPPTYSHGPRQLQNNAQNQAQNQMPYQTQNNGQVTAQNQATEFDKMAEAPPAGKSAAALAQNEPRRNEKAMKLAPPPPAAVPAPASGVSGGAAGGRAPRTDADAEVKRDQNKDQKVGAATETVEVTGEAQRAITEEKAVDSATLKKLKETQSVQSLGLIAANLRDASGPGVVRTPDERVFWLFTANGVVVKTEDGGKTTHTQKVGEGLNFVAGSAPDAKTCWLLAKKGIVLRTKDGGKKWATVTAPADGNFTMITGLDAMSALITDASRGMSYSTADGGATWKVVAQK